ncbi:MAG: NmrA/HSCARG family protein [Deinococcota bacterium]
MNEPKQLPKRYIRPVVVAGATGSQGGAVAHRLLERGHSVRALTRNPDKPAAQVLKQAGADVVQTDLMNRKSLEAALVGAEALFSVQDFLEAGVAAELEMGMNLTEAAASSNIQHLVYSGASTIDRHTGVPHLDSKWQIEQRVRLLDIPFTILRPAAFMDNWEWEREQIERDGSLRLPLRPDSLYRQVAVADIAAMAVTALEQPDMWQGQIVPLAGDVATPLTIAKTFSDVMGNPIHYEQISWEKCLQEQGEELTAMYKYFDTYGMDGEPQLLKRWHPEMHTLEHYLQAHHWDKASAVS